MQWHYLKRRIVNFIGIALTLIATAFTLFWLVWILTTLIGKGWQALDFSMLVQDTPPPGEIGGLRNAGGQHYDVLGGRSYRRTHRRVSGYLAG